MNSSYLIADAGGTSTQWCLCDSTGCPVASLKCSGINATTFNEVLISDALTEAKSLITDTDTIFFYGAGCKGEDAIRKVRDLISSFNSYCKIFIYSDLIAAARALIGVGSGIACILGTGSNSCAVSDGKIVMNTPPLGYLLGDEGSGTSLGKRLIRETLRGRINNQEIISEIENTTGLEMNKIVAASYKTDAPNKFFSSLAPILSKHRDIPDIQKVIYEEFNSFFKSCISPYISAGFRTIGYIGSVATAFESELCELSSRYGLEFKEVQTSPMPGLINFHKTNKL